jgi:predicted ATP-binding protein involved in virulence
VIKIESITIKELRGIRDLSLTLGNEPFVISGPNGSGKSGVTKMAWASAYTWRS